MVVGHVSRVGAERREGRHLVDAIASGARDFMHGATKPRGESDEVAGRWPGESHREAGDSRWVVLVGRRRWVSEDEVDQLEGGPSQGSAYP